MPRRSPVQNSSELQRGAGSVLGDVLGDVPGAALGQHSPEGTGAGLGAWKGALPKVFSNRCTRSESRNPRCAKRRMLDVPNKQSQGVRNGRDRDPEGSGALGRISVLGRQWCHAAPGPARALHPAGVCMGSPRRGHPAAALPAPPAGDLPTTGLGRWEKPIVEPLLAPEPPAPPGSSLPSPGAASLPGGADSRAGRN